MTAVALLALGQLLAGLVLAAAAGVALHFAALALLRLWDANARRRTRAARHRARRITERAGVLGAPRVLYGRPNGRL